MRKSTFCAARFYTTFQCSSHCVYCDIHRTAEYQHFQTLEASKAEILLRQIRELGCIYLDITGGEPTINPDLPRLLSFALGLGFETEVTTNGLRGADSTVCSCASRANIFNISLDTLDREHYRQIRGVDGLGAVLQCVEAVTALRRKRCMSTPKIMAVVSEHNVEDIPDLLRFAQEKDAELYLNLEFIYGAWNKNELPRNDGEELLSYAFMPNVVVPLHSMELYRDVSQGKSVLCGSNRQVLTFSPDGSLILPCYPAKQRRWLPWKGDLREMLSCIEFQEAERQSGKMEQCRVCTFTPYYGFSYYHLDKYFFLESFSNCLRRLKQSYLNPLGIGNSCNRLLQQHLQELLLLLRTLPEPSGIAEQLYYAHRCADGLYYADVYREPLTEEAYEQERLAHSCLELPRMPHHFALELELRIYRMAMICLAEESCRKLLSESAEFLLRWWKVCIGINMNVEVNFDLNTDKKWLMEILDKMEQLASANHWSPLQRPLELQVDSAKAKPHTVQ